LKPPLLFLCRVGRLFDVTVAVDLSVRWRIYCIANMREFWPVLLLAGILTHFIFMI
jgi:hypothetical protein